MSTLLTVPDPMASPKTRNTAKLLKYGPPCPCGCSPSPFLFISDGDTLLTVRLTEEDRVALRDALVHNEDVAVELEGVNDDSR